MSEDTTPRVAGFKRPVVDLAPDLVEELDVAYQPGGCTEVKANLRADEMYAPTVGPANPWKAEDISRRNVHQGYFEESHINAYTFDEEYKKHSKVQFSEWKSKKKEKDPVQLRKEWEEAEREKKKKAEEDGEEETVVTNGGEVIKREEGGKMVPHAKDEEAVEEADGITEGHEMYYEEDKKGNKVKKVIASKPEFTSHVKELYDYQGRNIISNPPSRPQAPECFPPKKLVHIYKGHNKGVHVVRWLPPSGHMFASGGLEGKVKLWDTFNDHSVIHTYNGHFRGIKDLNFNLSGSSFVTSAHDRFIREWDTETGKVLGTYSNGSLANCVKYHPEPDRQYEFFAGCTDKQLHQFDTRSGTIVRSYDQHLGPVNTCTFIDNNRKIVTTSDDKTMRVWEMDLPITITQVADPSMHSFPTTTMHPSGKYFGVQSMDNQILIYSATDRFQINKKKRFSGHITAGYACEVGFSHDGKLVSSGNGDGELFIWSWGNGRIIKHYKCHDKVLISHIWHPLESSKVLTCSWDSTIKLWD